MRFFLTLLVVLALSTPAEAQQHPKVPRIGYLSRTGDSKNPGPQVEGFRQGLRDLGYIEGKNILVEYRYIEGKSDSIPSLVAELVQVAQHTAGKIARIGYLGNEQSPSATPREEAFLQRLRDHGWIEGRNLLIERRYWDNRAASLPDRDIRI